MLKLKSVGFFSNKATWNESTRGRRDASDERSRDARSQAMRRGAPTERAGDAGTGPRARATRVGIGVTLHRVT